MKLYETLINQLKKENNFVTDEGEVKKWVVSDKARNYDAELLALLLENEDLKNTFFKDVNGVKVFLLEKFLLFIEQKNYLNDSYTAYRNKIGLTIGGRFLNQRNEVELVWPYKDCILEGGQTKEDQKRAEIFFNQTLAQDEITQLLDPKVLTNYKRYGTFSDDAIFHRDATLNEKRGLPTDTITDNLIIKGNNLLALHSLKKEFAGRVKLIYIDPPYYFNEDRDEDTFKYNSNFKLSTWCSFMKNRLDIAYELLSNDGALFVQINDDGAAELHCLLKEVFNKSGENNFINKIAIKTKSPSGFASVNPGVFETAEYIFAFAKHKGKWKYNQQFVESDYDENYKWYIENPRDDFSDWIIVDLFDFIAKQEKCSDKKEAEKKFGKTVFRSMVANFALNHASEVFRYTAINNNAADEVVKIRDLSKSNPNFVYCIERDNHYNIYVKNGQEMAFYSKKIRLIDGKKTPTIQLSNIWTDTPYEGIAKEGQVKLKGGKKPEKLLRRIIEMASNDLDIVLDFHLGSGTTAAVAHKINRQYIGIEQLDYGGNDSVVRLQNVINGDHSGISKSVGWNPQNPTLEDAANERYSRNNFIYLELKKFNQTFIERIEAAQDSETLLQIWQQMKEKSFLAYNIDIKTQEANMEEFKQLELAEQKQVLCELLDKNQLYVNVSDMSDSRFETSEEELKVTEAFYSKK